jgi:hypothetical protein
MGRTRSKRLHCDLSLGFARWPTLDLHYAMIDLAEVGQGRESDFVTRPTPIYEMGSDVVFAKYVS